LSESLNSCAVALPTSSSSPAGTWTYQSSAAQVADVVGSSLQCHQPGTTTITATFTPTDPTAYQSVTKVFTVAVTPAPVVTTTTTTHTTTSTVPPTTYPTTTTSMPVSTTTQPVASPALASPAVSADIFGAGDPSALSARIDDSSSGIVISAYSRTRDPHTRAEIRVDDVVCVHDDGTAAPLVLRCAPSSLAPGNHVVVVSARIDGRNVTLAGAVVSDSQGRVSEIIQPEVVSNFAGAHDPRLAQALRLHLPIYDPRSHPHGTAGIVVAAGALLALAGAGGVVRPARENAATGNSKKVAKVASATTKKLKSASRDGHVWGDRSGTWKSPLTSVTDRWGQAIPATTGPYSAVLSRVVADGAWLRAIIGGWYVIALLVAVGTAIVGLWHHAGVLYLPSRQVIVVMIALGILDALLAAVAWLVLVGAGLVTGTLISGGDLRTALGLGALTCTISLLGHAIRPLRRVATTNSDRVERVIDYLVMPVFVAFAGGALASALNGLSGAEIFSPAQIVAVRWVIVIVITLRLVGEDLAIYAYPERSTLTQPTRLPAPRTFTAVGSVVFKFAIYLLALYPYFGVSSATVVMSVLANLPAALKIIENRLPNSPFVHRWLPRGLSNFLVTLVVGAVSSRVLLGAHPTAARATAMLIPLMIPGVVLSVLSEWGREGDDWTNVTLRRTLGVAVWALALALVSGLWVIRW
jgi:hypothetical protein